MKLRFWQRDNDGGNTTETAPLPKVRELPQAVGQQMVVRLGEDPDEVWSLKMAYRYADGDKQRLLFRVFSPSTAKGRAAMIKDYDSLNAYMDLIVCSGIQDKRNGSVNFDPR